MSYLLQGLIDRVENDLPQMKETGRVITNIFQFKEQNITDTVQNQFYFRLANLEALSDYSFTDRDSVHEVRSRWVGIFQFEKKQSSVKYMQYIVSLMNLYSKNCIVPRNMSTDNHKIWLAEAKVANNDAEPKINYPFYLLRVEFDVIEETTFKLKLSEDCDNCESEDC